MTTAYWTTSQVDFDDADSWQVERWDGNVKTIERTGLNLIEAADDAATCNMLAEMANES